MLIRNLNLIKVLEAWLNFDPLKITPGIGSLKCFNNFWVSWWFLTFKDEGWGKIKYAPWISKTSTQTLILFSSQHHFSVIEYHFKIYIFDIVLIQNTFMIFLLHYQSKRNLVRFDIAFRHFFIVNVDQKLIMYDFYYHHHSFL